MGVMMQKVPELSRLRNVRRLEKAVASLEVAIDGIVKRLHLVESSLSMLELDAGTKRYPYPLLPPERSRSKQYDPYEWRLGQPPIVVSRLDKDTQFEVSDVVERA